MKSRNSLIAFLFLGIISAILSFFIVFISAWLLMNVAINVLGMSLPVWYFASYAFTFFVIGLILTFYIYEKIEKRFCPRYLSVESNESGNPVLRFHGKKVVKVVCKQSTMAIAKNAKIKSQNTRRYFRKRTQCK
jgi:hypothetical protein